MKKIILAIIISATAYAFWRWEFGWQITDNEVTGLVEKHAPIGSDKQRVVQFLDAHSWHRSEYEAIPSRARTEPGAIEYNGAGVIYAGFRNKGRILTYGKIGLVFVFDRQGKLIRYRVQQYLEAI